MANKMKNNGVAIQLSGVKKMYKLGQIGGGTLRADLQSWWARKQGKADPNTKIGEERLIGQTFMALNGIDLTIYQGEAVGIIGGNGAGKSTLLKLLSRVTAPTEGTIDIYGRIASMLEVGTGFNGEMTGRENVYMNGAILGMTKAEIDAKMEDIIEFSEVREFIDTPVKRYSSGMYVKLAFSVAAHLDSEIMIMDEVLAVGDMAFQKKCLNKMREAASKNGRTVLYVSHNMNTIRQLCDRCIVLDKGQVVYNGAVEEAIRRYLGGRLHTDTKINLSEIPRDSEFGYLPLHMTYFEVIDCVDACYPVGSVMKGILKFTTSSLKDDVKLRFIVKTIDGLPVTMLNTAKGCCIDVGEEKCVQFEADISHIAPGKYTIGPVLYEVDEVGGNINLDVLKDILIFEVMSTGGFNNNMPWLNRYWGNMYCEELKIVTNNC